MRFQRLEYFREAWFANKGSFPLLSLSHVNADDHENNREEVYTRGFRISRHIPEMGQMSSFAIQLISSISGRCVSNLSFSA